MADCETHTDYSYIMFRLRPLRLPIICIRTYSVP